MSLDDVMILRDLETRVEKGEDLFDSMTDIQLEHFAYNAARDKRSKHSDDSIWKVHEALLKLKQSTLISVLKEVYIKGKCLTLDAITSCVVIDSKSYI